MSGSIILELPKFNNATKAAIVKDYLDNPDSYVREFTVTINGREKKITTYQKGIKGSNLRRIHLDIVAKLKKKYVYSGNSFAFQKENGVKQCLNQHLHSVRFFKTDIHRYFDSITFVNASKKIKKAKLLSRFQQANLLEACFYKGSLPIGFVSSPIISDIYLHDFDQMMSELEGLVYTRYADDMIISVRPDYDSIDLSILRQKVEQMVSAEQLELNKKKTYVRHLNHDGDAIHLLGVNVVRQNEANNHITIGDRYIRDTSKRIAELLSIPIDEIDDCLNEVKGRISFIRYFSMESFTKLERIFRAHTKLDLSLTDANLEALVSSRKGAE